MVNEIVTCVIAKPNEWDEDHNVKKRRVKIEFVLNNPIPDSFNFTSIAIPHGKRPSPSFCFYVGYKTTLATVIAQSKEARNVAELLRQRITNWLLIVGKTFREGWAPLNLTAHPFSLHLSARIAQ